MEGEIVEAAISETVAVILGFLYTRNETVLSKVGDATVHAAGSAPETRNALDEGGGNDLVVLAAHLNGCEDSPVFAGEMAHGLSVQLHNGEPQTECVLGRCPL